MPGIAEIVVVANRGAAGVAIDDFGVASVVQEPQLGTGHAVRVALDALEPRAGHAWSSSAATCRSSPEDAVRRDARALDGAGPASLALVTARMPLPSNFGRIVRRGDKVERIVEERDATDGASAPSTR